jgi:hypothetical protein
MKTNWLKMYDKFGLILRVETVINAPHGVLDLSHAKPPRRHVIGWLLSHDQERDLLGSLSRTGVGL